MKQRIIRIALVLAVAVAIPTAVVLGHGPGDNGTSHANAHATLPDNQDQDQDQPKDADQTEQSGDRPHNHGWFVSQVAKDHSTTGRAHGEAVSKVARGDDGKPDAAH